MKKLHRDYLSIIDLLKKLGFLGRRAKSRKISHDDLVVASEIQREINAMPKIKSDEVRASKIAHMYMMYTANKVMYQGSKTVNQLRESSNMGMQENGKRLRCEN